MEWFTSARLMETRELDRKIRRLEREKDDIRDKMDQSLARWQQQKNRASNNLAGATWENSLAQEAETLRKRYQSEIDDVDKKIERARDRRDSL